MLKAVEGLFIKLFIHYKAYLYRPLDYRLALHTHHTHTYTLKSTYYQLYMCSFISASLFVYLSLYIQHAYMCVCVCLCSGMSEHERTPACICVCKLGVWMQGIPW